MPMFLQNRHFHIKTNKFDPVLFMLKIKSKKRLYQNFYECVQSVSPEILYDIIKSSNRDTWFASTIYEEMLKRYESVSYILSKENDSNRIDRLLKTILSLWMELRPLNNETVKTTIDVLNESLKEKQLIKLVSLTCPLYTIGRESVAESLIESRINFFIDLVSKSIGVLKDQISQWDIYAWDPSGLNDSILKKTVHPKLMAKPDLEEQLKRNWYLFNEIAKKLQDKLKFKVICRRYEEYKQEIYAARDILDDLEKNDKFHSKCIERMLRHGYEDYKKMGENIEEHRDRFWNDSYIYTGCILKYGMKNKFNEKLSMMISIESRIHHITGLRLYNFKYRDDKYLMPVWVYPTPIRSFYWANKNGNETEYLISSTLQRWKKNFIKSEEQETYLDNLIYKDLNV